MNTHLAWDLGAIAAGFADIGLGALVSQKTTKTYCGKRVAMRNIDNVGATCVECQTRRLHEIEIGSRLKAELDRLLPGETA